MSFSYGSIPPPDSPPLKATALSPAPARTDRRAKRHTTLSPSVLHGISSLSIHDSLSLSLHDDPLDLNSDTGSLHQLASALSRENMKRASTTGTITIPVPKMINPLPPHYRHPSPAPSTVPSLTASHESVESSSSACSLVSKPSTRSCRSVAAGVPPKPSLASLRNQSTSTSSSSDSLSSEPLTPTAPTFSRSRYVFSFIFQIDYPTLDSAPLLRDACPPVHLSSSTARPLYSRESPLTDSLFTEEKASPARWANSPPTCYRSTRKRTRMPSRSPLFQRFQPENKPPICRLSFVARLAFAFAVFPEFSILLAVTRPWLPVVSSLLSLTGATSDPTPLDPGIIGHFWTKTNVKTRVYSSFLFISSSSSVVQARKTRLSLRPRQTRQMPNDTAALSCRSVSRLRASVVGSLRELESSPDDDPSLNVIVSFFFFSCFIIINLINCGANITCAKSLRRRALDSPRYQRSE